MIPRVDSIFETFYQIFSMLQPLLPEEGEKTKKLVEAAQKQLSVPPPQEHLFYHEVKLLSAIQTALKQDFKEEEELRGEVKVQQETRERKKGIVPQVRSAKEASVAKTPVSPSSNPIQLVEQVKKLLQLLPSVTTVPSELVKKIQRIMRNPELRIPRLVETKVKAEVKIQHVELRNFESKSISRSINSPSLQRTDLFRPQQPHSQKAPLHFLNAATEKNQTVSIAPFPLPFVISSLASHSLKRKKENKKDKKEEDALFPHDREESLED